jgi:hypothetical protein
MGGQLEALFGAAGLHFVEADRDDALGMAAVVVDVAARRRRSSFSSR